MIVDYTQLVEALKQHTAALIAHTEALLKTGLADVKAVAEEVVTGIENVGKPRGRGRPTNAEKAAAAAAAAPAASTAVPTPPVAAAAAPAVSTATPAATVVTPAAAPAEPAEKPVEVVPTVQKVADAIIDLANTVSRDAAVKILKAYGAERVPQLKPESFTKVLADITAAKAAAAGLT